MIDIALIIQLFIWAAITIAFVHSTASSLFHPLAFYLFFHGVVFVFRPLLVHYFEYHNIFNHIGFFPTNDQFIFTLIISTFGLIVFSIASWFAGFQIPKYRHDPIRTFSRRDTRALTLTTLILSPYLIVSAYEAIKTISIDGSEGLLLNINQNTGIATYVDTTGYLVGGQLMLAPLCLMFIWFNRFRWWSFIPLFGFILYRSIIGWGRWSIVLTLGSLLLMYLFDSRRKWIKLRQVFLLIPGYMLFWALGVQRDLIRGWILGVTPYTINERPSEEKWSLIADSPDYANFDYLAFIISVVPDRSQTYSYFTQYLQLFTEPIPRILWPGKPIGQPIDLINLNLFGRFANFTNSLVGDGWMSAGWFGVLLTMALVGYFLGRLHQSFWKKSHEGNIALFYCLFLPLTTLWFRDGGISIAKFTLFMLFPVLLWKLVRRFILSPTALELGTSTSGFGTSNRSRR